jgi:DNA-binding NarL/FixJ family response regulator
LAGVGEPNIGTIRVLIADDHGLVRNGLRLVVEDEPNMIVVGEAEDGEQALDLASTLRPDILLLDISMPPPDGIEVARRLSAASSGVRVLMLTMHEDPTLVREALAAGAAGYMIKRAVADELISAIHAVAAGGSYVHPAVR